VTQNNKQSHKSRINEQWIVLYNGFISKWLFEQHEIYLSNNSKHYRTLLIKQHMNSFTYGFMTTRLFELIIIYLSINAKQDDNFKCENTTKRHQSSYEKMAKRIWKWYEKMAKITWKWYENGTKIIAKDQQKSSMMSRTKGKDQQLKKDRSYLRQRNGLDLERAYWDLCSSSH